MNLSDIRTIYERRKGKQEQLLKTIEDLETNIVRVRTQIKVHERAEAIIREVGLLTQKQLSFHISNITNLAMTNIFDEPYELVMNFVESRGKIDCELSFEKDEENFEPMQATGGGVVDVASFALRIACWSIKRPKYRPVIILDEPLRFLSINHQEKASQMIKQLSEKLGIQFIIVTHETTLTQYADKIFTVKNKKGVSTVI